MRGLCFLLLLLILTVTGCITNDAVYEKNISISSEGWFYDNPVSFDVPIKKLNDTLDIFVNVRHSKEFEWRNLWVVITTILPDGEKLSKRVNLKLENSKGETFGKCTGDICFVQVPIQYNAIFPDTGIYTFTIEQSMRVDPLENLEHIGMRFDHSNYSKMITKPS